MNMVVCAVKGKPFIAKKLHTTWRSCQEMFPDISVEFETLPARQLYETYDTYWRQLMH